jgi:hypothetical protein
MVGPSSFAPSGEGVEQVCFCLEHNFRDVGKQEVIVGQRRLSPDESDNRKLASIKRESGADIHCRGLRAGTTLRSCEAGFRQARLFELFSERGELCLQIGELAA